MISNKKSYTMRMLQLALALSLLQVDPDNYLQQRLRNWDSQLELRDGDGWELEMLRAVPMVEYPYANRKTMMPLIEDLIRFDRQDVVLTNTNYNVTAYLVNISNDTSNTTAAMQEFQTISPSGAASTTTAAVAPASATGTMGVEDDSTRSTGPVVTVATSTNFTHINLNFPSPDLEQFLNSEQFHEQHSIWEQNLADLSDFNDLPIVNSYANLPLKDGQQQSQDNNFMDLHLEDFLPSFASATSNNEATEGAVALNDSFPNPDDGVGIKLEELDDEDNQILQMGIMDNKNSCWKSSATENTMTNNNKNNNNSLESCVKREPEIKEEEVEKIVINVKEEERNSSVFEPDLNPEESEIVEVLWKQDVDLGYSLTSEQSSLNVPSSTSAKAANSDDIEKLKALEELKLDGTKYDTKNINNENDQLDDDWAGIPFTIDNETGEYIRLPLDEILNDVIQFAELAGETGEINENSNGASTSAAAAAIVNNQNSIKLKSEKDIEQHNNDELTGNNNNSAFKSKKTTTTTTLKTIKSEVDVKREKSIEVSQKNKKNNNNKTESEASTKNKGKVEENGDDDNDDDDEYDLTQSEVDSLPSPLFDLDDEAKEELADLDMMLHSSAPFAPHHHPHPHAHHPHHHHHHHHHHRATGTTTGSQNYGGVNSAFHRQPSSTGGFHHGHHQGRMPLSRGVSVEQRLQDIASLFNPMGVVGGVSEMSPYSHYPTHHYSYQSATQHAQYPPPPPPPPPHPHHHHHHATVLHPNASLGDLCSTQPHYGHNLGSAVSSSMHLTNSTHDTDVSGVGAVGGVSNVGAYKMEHDMLYYSNATSDMNHTTDGFINSILNDEDLHLMDMNVNVNDNFCRMVDVNNSTSNNSSVLGLSGGHASATGAGPVSSSGLSMSGNNVNAAPGGAATMTAELMVTGSGQTSGDRLDASSDSAVSSMGSERVSSLSDGEWGEGSDSAQDYHPGKYGGPYDYSYNSSTTNSRLHDGTRQPPVAQKKHHMFGKRFLNEQPPGSNVATVAAASSATNANSGVLHGPAQSIKYEYEPYPPAVAGLHQNMGNGIESGVIAPILTNKEHHSYGGGAYSLDFSLRPPRTPQELIQHNHTYTMPQGSGSIPRPQLRDKKSISSSTSIKSMKSTNSSGSGGEDDVYMTRDEKRARAMNIPIPVPDIINLPMDEFNERLSKYDLSENQLSLIRDIRRRGKNKVAAQNCRKRKLDQILSLEDEVKQVRRRKDELQQQRDRFLTEHKRVSNKFSALHRHIFQYLRDADGNPCSTSEYSLQQASDGSIYLLPRDASNNNKNEAMSSMNGNSGILPSTVSGNSNNNSNSTILAPHQIQTSMSTTSTHHQQQHTTQVTMAHNHLQQQQQQQQQQQHHIHPHHQTQQNQVTATATVAQTQQSTQTTGNGISGAGGGGHYQQQQKD